MRQFIIITILFLLSTQAVAYNPSWTRTDKKLITALIGLNKYNPKEIAQFFIDRKGNKNDLEQENLGFGWSMRTYRIGGGYISIHATFFYYKDSLVSYSLMPQMPDKKGLVKRYKKWYGNYFQYSNGEILPFEFNKAATLQPLKEYKGSWPATSDKILHYMSPNSGTMYGYSGGGIIMQNRKTFLEIKDSLTNEQVILLMYSINPASRLTAIEYYLKNNARFARKEFIDKWIEENFIELPEIDTMYGCFRQTVETRSLFYPYLLSGPRY
ncbi:MAG TPA: hypothetical protein VD993_15760 [Chitinophagaceae bacterium]|nr:hypothetical protein [Chitinophagaceae bacterium]